MGDLLHIFARLVRQENFNTNLSASSGRRKYARRIAVVWCALRCAPHTYLQRAGKNPQQLAVTFCAPLRDNVIRISVWQLECDYKSNNFMKLVWGSAIVNF